MAATANLIVLRVDATAQLLLIDHLEPSVTQESHSGVPWTPPPPSKTDEKSLKHAILHKMQVCLTVKVNCNYNKVMNPGTLSSSETITIVIFSFIISSNLRSFIQDHTPPPPPPPEPRTV